MAVNRSLAISKRRLRRAWRSAVNGKSLQISAGATRRRSATSAPIMHASAGNSAPTVCATRPRISSAPVSASTRAPDPEPEPVVERLGSQLLEGLLVTGRRITWTIPVGAEGNDHVVRVVTETWDSSAMGITLLNKSSDPRSGDVVKRMTNLRQTEPDPALFQVPADYTISGQ